MFKAYYFHKDYGCSICIVPPSGIAENGARFASHEEFLNSGAIFVGGFSIKENAEETAMNSLKAVMTESDFMMEY